jgi:hypothetical protein
MNKTAAILLLGILIFNLFGYQLFVAFMENSDNNRLEAMLDRDNYDETALISIKVPATILPYYTNSKLFDRVDGQIEIDGFQYKYVKRRVFNNFLELLCIPNKSGMSLQKAKDDYFKSVNDLQPGAQTKRTGSQSNFSKNITLEYFSRNNNIDLAGYFSSLDLVRCNQYHSLLSTSFASLPEQPPENC